MRIHYKRRGFQRPTTTIYRSNERILNPEVRVIDEQGVDIGILKQPDALALARERGYDLVEVSPKAQPPVCRLLDYGQFKYHKDKEQRAQKAHARKVEVKGIRLSVKMGGHDEDIRRAKAAEFLDDGHKLKIEIILRGREKAHTDIARSRIDSFIAKLQETYPLFIEQPFTRQAGNCSAIVGRK